MKRILPLLLICFATTLSAQNLVTLGHLPYNVVVSGGWHYVDSLGNEYALVGANNRISIVDVTNPASPVEVFNVPALPGQNSAWRELKTYKKHAYAVSEGGGGVIIIDLTWLPDSINFKHWYGDGAINGMLQDGHTIAATDDHIYIFGHNLGLGGCIIANISDPWNPTYAGQYNETYIHDGYIRNDTLWAGEIYDGQFSVIDVTNKAAPFNIATQPTPGAFCHNVWLSDDGSHAFTTDEITNTPLGSFDVSDLSNISKVDEYFTDSLPTREVHNVRVLNDFLINPSYGSQITIVDAARPHNLIEVAHASTQDTGMSYLCWDASPYLPSGNIIATDKYNGLYIFHPDYARACYLEGTVSDSITGNMIANAVISIIATPKFTTSKLDGSYATGLADAGTYDVTFSAAGYYTRTYTGITLANGVLTTLNGVLVPTSVSIHENPENAFNAWIDAGDNLNLHRSGDLHGEIKVLDQKGRLVMSSPFSERISMKHLPGGIYIVSLVEAGHVLGTIRVMKK